MFKLVVPLSDQTGCCLTETRQSGSCPVNDACAAWCLISDSKLSSSVRPSPLGFISLHFRSILLLLYAHPVLSLVLFFPPSLLWCVCQQHSCLEQSARADICRTVSLIWSVAWSIGVMKSSSRQSKHHGRQSESSVSVFLVFLCLCFSVSLIKIHIAHSRAHTRVLSCLLSLCWASVVWTV